MLVPLFPKRFRNVRLCDFFQTVEAVSEDSQVFSEIALFEERFVGVVPALVEESFAAALRPVPLRLERRPGERRVAIVPSDALFGYAVPRFQYERHRKSRADGTVGIVFEDSPKFVRERFVAVGFVILELGVLPFEPVDGLFESKAGFRAPLAFPFQFFFIGFEFLELFVSRFDVVGKCFVFFRIQRVVVESFQIFPVVAFSAGGHCRLLLFPFGNLFPQTEGQGFVFLQCPVIREFRFVEFGKELGTGFFKGFQRLVVLARRRGYERFFHALREIDPTRQSRRVRRGG